MESQPTDLERSLLSQLECPVCFGYMVPPIMLCVNGHNVCKACRKKVSRCPTCRCKLADTRNEALENLAGLVKYPCTYRDSGCKKSLPYSEIEEHEKKCRYTPQVCPLFKLERKHCRWTGTYREMKKHLKKEHPGVLCDHISEKHRVYDEVDCCDWKEPFFVSVYDEIFCLVFRVKGKALYVVVQCVGPPENAAKYKYEVEFSKEDFWESVTVMQRIRSYDENLDDIFRSEDCGKLPYDAVRRLIRPDECLSFTLEIIRNDSSPLASDSK